MTDGANYTLRRCRDVEEVIELLGVHEPIASPLIGVALEHGLGSRTTRCMIARDRAGNLAGAVLIHRAMVNEWIALAVLVDIDAAKVVAQHIDGGPATTVQASVTHAQALTGAMTRVRRSEFARGARLPHPVIWDSPDPRCRFATPDDLDALVDIFGPSPLNGLPNRWMLRRRLRAELGSIAVFINDNESTPVGMANIVTKSRRWMVGGNVVIRPEHRGQGASWALVSFFAKVAQDAQLGVIAFVRDSNPMSVPEDAIGEDDHLFVILRPPRRFKGEPRLHRLLTKVLTRPFDREEDRTFSHDRVDRSRRTQATLKAKTEKSEG